LIVSLCSRALNTLRCQSSLPSNLAHWRYSRVALMAHPYVVLSVNRYIFLELFNPVSYLWYFYQIIIFQKQPYYIKNTFVSTLLHLGEIKNTVNKLGQMIYLVILEPREFWIDNTLYQNLYAWIQFKLFLKTIFTPICERKYHIST